MEPVKWRFFMSLCTEVPKMVCTWLREICFCSCLPVLPDPAWVLLSKIYKPCLGALYRDMLKYFPRLRDSPLGAGGKSRNLGKRL